MDMTTTPQYRWPTKIRKFQISDPFLMLLVSKYENEIPWQRVVRNQEDLANFVSSMIACNNNSRMPGKRLLKAAARLDEEGY